MVSHLPPEIGRCRYLIPMDSDTCRWSVFLTADEVFTRAAELIAAAADASIGKGGRFRIVLSGGRTPPLIYAKLKRISTDWGAWDVFFSDERCLPSGHADRNDRLAWDTWFARLISTTKPRVYSIPAELGPERGADAYAQLIRDIDTFDFALLGLGEDGHTASLFPGGAWKLAANVPAAIPVYGAPKAPPERVSLSPWRLSAISTVVFVVVGAEKRAAIAAWRAGADLPPEAIRPANGVDVLLDTHAAGSLLSPSSC